MARVFPNKKLASSKEELLNKIKQDRHELEQWVKMSIENPYISEWLKIPNYALPFFGFMLSKLGGTGNLSLKLRNVAMDLDKSGDVTEEEFSNNIDSQTAMIDQALTLLTTMGVVGALIFSVLFSTVLSPLEPSDVSTSYFHPNTLTGFTYAYYAFVYYALGRSFTLVFQSVVLYLKLGFWMPDLPMKMWFLARTPLRTVVYNGVFALVTVSLSIPFGEL